MSKVHDALSSNHREDYINDLRYIVSLRNDEIEALRHERDALAQRLANAEDFIDRFVNLANVYYQENEGEIIL